MSPQNVPTIDIGIEEAQRLEIAEGLSHLLADTYTLYLKTHNYHWNVVGPMFNTLHLMFETQYNELALAVDEIAERIRALGVLAPGSYTAYADLTSIADDTDQPDANEMIRRLVAGQETVARTARSIFPAAEQARRRADRRPPHTAHAGPREDRLDAAQPAGLSAAGRSDLSRGARGRTDRSRGCSRCRRGVRSRAAPPGRCGCRRAGGRRRGSRPPRRSPAHCRAARRRHRRSA